MTAHSKSSQHPSLLSLLTLSLRGLRGRGKGEGAAVIIGAAIGIGTLLFSSSVAFTANLDESLAKRKPDATIDLGKEAGVQLVKAEWRYSDTKIVEVDFKAAGADGQPSGAPSKAYDFTPRAGGIEFDDSKWEVIDPTTLDKRRSAGRLAFNWYRIKITVPERIGNFNPAGSTLVFAASIDDYVEIWVDGELPRAAEQSGGSVIKGWNAENRLIVGRDVRPGQKIQLAIFGINGPVSNPPTNYIYLRYEGKRLNSPNDLVYRSDGTLFFTDPPFGLPKFYDDPRKELQYSGVFALYRGQLKLLTTDLKGPNGIAFSPDEKYLFIACH
jgi:hypothetical protein